MARPLILLVDDEVENLELYSRILRSAGHEVSLARSGEECLKNVEETLPDLIVSDVVMPGLNGFQLCRRLKLSARTSSVPVLLISGKVDPADTFWAEETGAAALLGKPVDKLLLTEKIAALLAAAPTNAPGSGEPQ